jgi:hypothetical protein
MKTKKMVSTEEKLQKALTFSMLPFLLLPVVLLLLPSLHASTATADDICIAMSGSSRDLNMKHMVEKTTI